MKQHNILKPRRLYLIKLQGQINASNIEPPEANQFLHRYFMNINQDARKWINPIVSDSFH